MLSTETPNDHRTVDATAGTVLLHGRNTLGVRARAAGDIKLRMASGTEIVYTVVAGEILYGQFTAAVNPGTTAQFDELFRGSVPLL